MKSNIIPALAAIVGLALCLPVTVSAQSNPVSTTAPAPKVKAKKSNGKTEYVGTLTAVDTTGNTVTVEPKKGPALTLAIASTTKILKDKKPATLSDFAVGQKVTGSYVKDAAGTLTAASLHEKTTSSSAKTAMATPATPASTAPTTTSAPVTQ